ncbi:hypothetical protein ACLOJK_036556 [Asimina triloba]
MAGSLSKKPKPVAPKRSPSVKMIASPNPNKADEIIHSSHPQHPLTLVYTPYLFRCMGCKEFGAGPRFKCNMCDYDLHDFCALASPSIQSHPLHCLHQLVFYSKPGGLLRSKCDVCGKSTKGYNYRCTTCNIEIHPSCTMLYPQMDLPTHPHTLMLTTATAIPSGETSFFCGECQRKRSGRVYYCPICNYHLHAVCAKDTVNGLYLHGLKAPETPSILGVAVRIASHAVTGFLGGLIEGFGEGVGEVLVDNIGRVLFMELCVAFGDLLWLVEDYLFGYAIH